MALLKVEGIDAAEIRECSNAPTGPTITWSPTHGTVDTCIGSGAQVLLCRGMICHNQWWAVGSDLNRQIWSDPSCKFKDSMSGPGQQPHRFPWTSSQLLPAFFSVSCRKVWGIRWHVVFRVEGWFDLGLCRTSWTLSIQQETPCVPTWARTSGWVWEWGIHTQNVHQITEKY